MKEKDKIFKLIDYIDNDSAHNFMSLIEYANCNDLIKTLNKYNNLFIKAFEDNQIEHDYTEYYKKWDKFEEESLLKEEEEKTKRK